MVATSAVATRPITTYDVLRGLVTQQAIRVARVSLNAEREKVMKEWRETIRLQPPGERKKWLRTQRAISALGAEMCAHFIEGIDHDRGVLEKALASSTWMDAWTNEEISPPHGHAEAKPLHWRGVWRPNAQYSRGDGVRYRGCYYRARESSQAICPVAGKRTDHWEPTEARRYAVRWILGQGLVRYGDEGRPTRRWTPPQAVSVEDAMDLMGDLEARFYRFPPSPSAMAIRAAIAFGKKDANRIGASGRMPGWIR